MMFCRVQANNKALHGLFICTAAFSTFELFLLK
jgi:hypothetical protein